MSSHQLYSSSFTIFFLFLVLVDPRISFADNLEINKERFNNCTTVKFECDDQQQGITYPFWGNNRPGYCGFPDYKLGCENGFTQIEINFSKYRVLRIDGGNKTMRISNIEFLDGACPSQFSNVTLINSTIFGSGELSFLNIFYGCPSGWEAGFTDPFKFKCQTNLRNSTSDNAYFVPPVGLSTAQALPKCDMKVVVPIMDSDIRTLATNTSLLGPILRDGFELAYGSAVAANFTFCDRCFGSGGQCAFDSTLDQHTCFCANGIASSQTLCTAPAVSLTTSRRKKIAIGVGARVIGVIVVSLIMIITCCMRKQYSLHCQSTTFQRKKTKENVHQNMEVFFKNCGSLAPKRYLYSDIKKMTNYFEQKLGEGGFGSVYKGKLHDGMLVAVKVLFNKSEKDGEDFVNEVGSISRTSHVNIVTLHGFCFEKKKMALIYEFMPNGSLEKYIYSKDQSHQLGWETIYQISIGIARGLEYLHRGCTTQILHFDIKPHNVLLDQDFCPKISDFGLAKLCPRKESMISILCARGTPGYIAPEVFCRNFGRVSYKSDVYSYGMMILEMVGGRKNIDVKLAMDHSSQLYFPHWIYERLDKNEDLGLHGVWSEDREELARKMIIVGLWCIQTNPSNRPSMSKVVEMLEGTIEALRIPPKPMLSSPTKSPPLSSSNIVSAM